MIKNKRWLLISLILVFLTIPAFSFTEHINFQGRVTFKTTGTPESGSKSADFELHRNAGGSDLVDTINTTITCDVNGIFSTLLDFDSSDFADGGDRWLKVTVAGDVLSPLQKIAVVPYAYYASVARNINSDASTLIITGETVIIDATTLEVLGDLVVNGYIYGDGSNLTGVVTRISSSGAVLLSGEVTFLGGENITITQNNQQITISGEAGGSSIWTETGNIVSYDGSLEAGGPGNQASGRYSAALGAKTIASGYTSFASGYASFATGPFSVAFGDEVEASGSYSFAQGFDTQASGNGSVSMGNQTIANGTNSVAMGNQALAMHSGTFVWADNTVGNFTSTKTDQFLIRASNGVGIGTTLTLSEVSMLRVAGTIESTLGGIKFPDGSIQTEAITQSPWHEVSSTRISFEGAVETGGKSEATGIYSVAMGHSSKASGYAGIALGYGTLANNAQGSIAIGVRSTSSGYGGIALGIKSSSGDEGSIALGKGTIAYGKPGSIAMGFKSTSTGYGGIASGYQVSSEAKGSVAMGFRSRSSGIGSTAIGNNVTAESDGSVAMGYESIATANKGAVAMGFRSTSSGYGGVALGKKSNAESEGSIAMGQYSKATTNKGAVAMGLQSTSSGYGGIALGHKASSGQMGAIALGNNVTANNNSSMATGYKGIASHDGTFVWADKTDENFISTRTNQYIIRAAGGVGIGTNLTSPEVSLLRVAGTIESTLGGIKFPDGTIATTAATGGGGAYVDESGDTMTGNLTMSAGDIYLGDDQKIYYDSAKQSYTQWNSGGYWETIIPSAAAGGWATDDWHYSIYVNGANDFVELYARPDAGGLANALRLYGDGGKTQINYEGGDYDTQISGDADPYLVYANAGTNKVGIGTNAPSEKLQVVGTVEADFFKGDGTQITGITATDSTKVLKAGDTMTGVLTLDAGVHIKNDQKFYVDTSANVYMEYNSSSGTWDFYAPVGTGVTPGLWIYSGNGANYWGLNDSGMQLGVAVSPSDPYQLINITLSEFAVNDGDNDYDFSVGGSGEANLLFANAETNKIGIGTPEPQSKLHVVGTIETTGTGGIKFPDGTVQTTKAVPDGTGPWTETNGVRVEYVGSMEAGGSANQANGIDSVAIGGDSNTASGHSSFIGGGSNNMASEYRSFVGGGFDNTASGSHSFVAGGSNNTASGLYSFVGGGQLNTASSLFSAAMGHRATSLHPGTFVWADSLDVDFASTKERQFLIRASNGVGIGTTLTSSEVSMLRVAGTIESTLGGIKFPDGTVQTTKAVPDGTGPWIETVNTVSYNGSMEVGVSNNANGANSVATGQFANALGNQSVAMGYHATTSNAYAFALGRNVNASAFSSTVIGDYSTASGSYSRSIGVWNLASNNNAVAIGTYNVASGNTSTAIGSSIEVSGDYSFGIGLSEGSDGNISSNNTMAIMGGNVGIGTVEPQSQLHVVGTIETTGIGGIKFPDGTIQTTKAVPDGTGPWTETNGVRVEYVGSMEAGGSGNQANGIDSVAIGGNSNTASGHSSFIGGGSNNTASEYRSFVGGGLNNTASGSYSFVAGGTDNTASGLYSFAGGESNIASGTNSAAMGYRATSLNAGTFVWADNKDVDFISTADKQFLIRAGGGVGIGTFEPQSQLHVVGTIETTGIGGIKFPDTTIQTTAFDSGSYVATSGDTMTGVLTLDAGAHIKNDQKFYVDTSAEVYMEYNSSAQTWDFYAPDEGGSGPGLWMYSGNGVNYWGLNNEGMQLGVATGTSDPYQLINITLSEFAVNDGNNDYDFSVGGSGEANLLFANAETNKIGIGTSEPQEKLHVVGNVTVEGDIFLSGKLISVGGVDPPYVLYDAETRQSIIDRVSGEVPKAKRNGAVLFWNSDFNRFEVYLPSIGEFRDINGNLLEKSEEASGSP